MMLTFEEFVKLPIKEKCARYGELSDRDKLRARLSMDTTSRTKVMCNTCRHYLGYAKCKAYPDGIPRELIARLEHDTPYPGDQGYRYQPKE